MVKYNIITAYYAKKCLCFLYIEQLLKSVTKHIGYCQKDSYEQWHILCYTEQRIMCPNTLPKRLWSNAMLTAAIACEVLLKQIAGRLAHYL